MVLTAEIGRRADRRDRSRPERRSRSRLSAPAGAPEVVVFRLSRSFVPRRVGGSEDSRELGVVAVFAPPG